MYIHKKQSILPLSVLHVFSLKMTCISRNMLLIEHQNLVLLRVIIYIAIKTRAPEIVTFNKIMFFFIFKENMFLNYDVFGAVV
jgi:hypothetical protein